MTGNIERAFGRMQAHSCADVDADACADVDTLALAHACADVDVRACLHAPHHARGGLTGTDAQACTLTHAHHGTCGRRTRAQSWAPTHNALSTELFPPALGTAPILVHIRAGTDAHLRWDERNDVRT